MFNHYFLFIIQMLNWKVLLDIYSVFVSYLLNTYLIFSTNCISDKSPKEVPVLSMLDGILIPFLYLSIYIYIYNWMLWRKIIVMRKYLYWLHKFLSKSDLSLFIFHFEICIFPQKKPKQKLLNAGLNIFWTNYQMTRINIIW